MKDSFDYQILNLTKDFYLSYPSPPYTELISKEQRPYNCLLIQSHYDYFICIPYRSSISHKYAFKFHNSASGSRIMFTSDKYQTKILLHKPHPRKELLEYQIKQLIEQLEQEGLI